MEYMETDLMDCFQLHCRYFTFPLVKHVLLQIAQCIKWIHDRNIVHADLKLENLMFDSRSSKPVTGSSQVRLTDFDAAVIPQLNQLGEEAGTPGYMSPQRLHNPSNTSPSKADDIWSFGIITFILLTNLDSPYRSFGFASKSSNISELDLPTSKEISHLLTQPMKKLYSASSEEILQAQDFVVRLLDPQPNFRLTISQTLKHPFLVGFLNA
jgi:serine/threonine protein kinase